MVNPGRYSPGLPLAAIADKYTTVPNFTVEMLPPSRNTTNSAREVFTPLGGMWSSADIPGASRGFLQVEKNRRKAGDAPRIYPDDHRKLAGAYSFTLQLRTAEARYVHPYDVQIRLRLMKGPHITLESTGA